MGRARRPASPPPPPPIARPAAAPPAPPAASPPPRPRPRPTPPFPPPPPRPTRRALTTAVPRAPLLAGRPAVRLVRLVDQPGHPSLHPSQRPCPFAQHVEVVILCDDGGLACLAPLLVDDHQALGQTRAPVLRGL